MQHFNRPCRGSIIFCDLPGVCSAHPWLLFCRRSAAQFRFFLTTPVTHEKGSTPTGCGNRAQGWRRFLPPTLGLSAFEVNPNGDCVWFFTTTGTQPILGRLD